MVEVKRKPNNFLGVKDLGINIKELPKYFKILLLVAIVVILFFNFFNVQGATQGGFIPLAKYDSVKTGGSLFGNNNSAAVAIAVLYSLNGLASFTGVLALAMIINGKTSQYFGGLINAVFYGLFALSVGYIGDVVMNFILICGASLGGYLFEVKGLAYKQQKKYTGKFNLVFYLYVVLAATLCTLVFYEFLPQANKDISPDHNYGIYVDATARVLDSLANGMQIVGYVMQLTNMPQQFIVGLFVDIVKVLKFTGISSDGGNAQQTFSINMLIEFGVGLSIATYGAIKSYILPIFRRGKTA